MEEKVKLEAQVADLTLQMSTLLSGAKGGDVENAMSKLNTDRRRIGRAAGDADAREQEAEDGDSPPMSARSPRSGTTSGRTAHLLREQMNDLAAEVINITSMLEGPGSPIAKALSLPVAGCRGRAWRFGTEDHQPRRPRARPAEGRFRRLIVPQRRRAARSPRSPPRSGCRSPAPWQCGQCACAPSCQRQAFALGAEEQRKPVAAAPRWRCPRCLTETAPSARSRAAARVRRRSRRVRRSWQRAS